MSCLRDDGLKKHTCMGIFSVAYLFSFTIDIYFCMLCCDHFMLFCYCDATRLKLSDVALITSSKHHCHETSSPQPGAPSMIDVPPERTLFMPTLTFPSMVSKEGSTVVKLSAWDRGHELELGC